MRANLIVVSMLKLLTLGNQMPTTLYKLDVQMLSGA